MAGCADQALVRLLSSCLLHGPERLQSDVLHALKGSALSIMGMRLLMQAGLDACMAQL